MAEVATGVEQHSNKAVALTFECLEKGGEHRIAALTPYLGEMLD